MVARHRAETRDIEGGRREDAARRSAPSIALPEPSEASHVKLLNVGAKADAPKAIGAGTPNTVIYVHGINNKPPASVLKCQWDTALFGVRLGDRSRMAYWVNRDYYPVPLGETCASGDVINIDDDEASTRAIMALAHGESGEETLAIAREIESMTNDPGRRILLAEIAQKMLDGSETPAELAAAGVVAQDIRAKILPFPKFLRKLVAGKLTRAFLRDVNDFLFVKERRDLMEKSFLERLTAGGGPFVVIAHSQGTLIAYDVLRQLSRAEIQVPLLVTIGSPLGMQEVQDMLRQWTGGNLPFPACVDRWLNVADRLDPVAVDTNIADDFEGRIENIPGPGSLGLGINLDSPRHPHSATGYLRSDPVRSAVRETVGTAFQQAIAPFTIASDLVGELENSHSGQRHEVLIELRREGPSEVLDQDRDTVRAAIGGRLADIVSRSGGVPGDAGIEHLNHYVAARLTRLEVETLRSLYKDLRINGVWKDAGKRAFINDSAHTVQAKPANIGYGADGKNIGWAVLDTGIRADHPHFAKHANIILQWDCTQSGEPVRLKPGDDGFDTLDKNGHGTHVAAIIGGECQARDATGADVTFSGMAPRTTLMGFKVLDDQGNGKDRYIIKALDTIASINAGAGQIVIHGVNLSLGGSFDPSVFGTGHTPLCVELRRLWRQGVLVCLAAGNEGFAILSGADGEIQANLDLSIGDPANLEEAIAVGSVHKTNPHTYGISYFSSRGPTADGRRKPDVVAPGEKILSARHDFNKVRANRTPSIEDLYVQMSGTSMATPHVSGVLAAFLSMRREFIGDPDRVKDILLKGCIDLRRDPYMQGAGLPNLIQMLAFN